MAALEIFATVNPSYDEQSHTLAAFAFHAKRTA